MSTTSEHQNSISIWLTQNDIHFDHENDYWMYKIDINGVSTIISIFALDKGYVQLADFQLDVHNSDITRVLPLINAINTRFPYGNLEINNELLNLKMYHFWHDPDKVSKSLEITNQTITFFVVKFYSLVRACIENVISTEDAIAKLP